MKYFKDKILPILIGCFITGLIALFMSLFSELLPTISPFLKNVPAFLYLKIILLLSTIFLIACFLVLVFYQKSKKFRPYKIKGKYQGFRWVADIKEYDSHMGWNVWVSFMCPVHGVYLGCKNANVPECSYSVLWCRHCNKEYPIYAKGDVIYLEEAKRLIEDDVVSKIRIDQGQTQSIDNTAK